MRTDIEVAEPELADGEQRGRPRDVGADGVHHQRVVVRIVAPAAVVDDEAHDVRRGIEPVAGGPVAGVLVGEHGILGQLLDAGQHHGVDGLLGLAPVGEGDAEVDHDHDAHHEEQQEEHEEEDRGPALLGVEAQPPRSRRRGVARESAA